MNTLFPERRPGIVIDSATGEHRILFREQDRQYFRLGVREANFLEALDGTRSQEELRAGNEQNFTAEQVDALLAWFEQKGLLGATAVLAGAEQKRTWYSRVFATILRPDELRIHLYNPDKLLNRHRGVVDALFSRGAIAAYLLILLAPVSVYLVRPEPVAWAYQRTTAFTGVMWVCLYVMILVMNAAHEMAHAIACKHFGGRVEKIGLMFLYLNPVVYCDVSDGWRFRNANHKIVVATAGLFLQLLFTSIGLTVWMLTGSALVLRFVLINTFLIAFNCFPFVKLDGYWILVHLLDEPNLKSKGLAAVRRAFGNRKKDADRPLAQADRPFVRVFGFLHITAVPLFWSLGLYGLYQKLSHASITLALIAVALFGINLLYRAGKFVSGAQATS